MIGFSQPARSHGDPRRRVPRRHGAVWAVAFFGMSVLCGCAIGGYAPDPAPSMPAARQALPVEYRIFYDALEDFGDWVLIEPYGYVFRPRVSFVGWRPYTEGYWVPTSLYGWVWVSSEPFGWATYHYGEWGYDRFQGWVWLPGPVWGPAWVEWVGNDEFVGWAPLMPPGVNPGTIPGGPYVFVPTMQLPSTNLAPALLAPQQVTGLDMREDRVRNVAEREGVRFNLGPSIETVERIVGPLRRVRLDDQVADVTATGLEASGDSVAISSHEETVRVARRVGMLVAEEARSLVKSGAPPPERLPVVRPLGKPRPATEAKSDSPRIRKKRNSDAPADSAR